MTLHVSVSGWWLLLLASSIAIAAEPRQRPAAAPKKTAPAADAPPARPGLDLSLLTIPAVQKALKLTPQAVQSVAAVQKGFERKLLEEQEERMRAARANGRTVPAIAKNDPRLERRRAELSQLLRSVKLTDAQTQRLEQIQLQQQGLAALLDAKNSESLKLTDENRAALAAKQTEMAGQPKHEQIKAGLVVLNEEQRQAWQKLAGALVEIEDEKPAPSKPTPRKK